MNGNEPDRRKTLMELILVHNATRDSALNTLCDQLTPRESGPPITERRRTNLLRFAQNARALAEECETLASRIPVEDGLFQPMPRAA